MFDNTEVNNLQIYTDGCDTFCLSSARELSITRDVGERLVFAQMSEITFANVAEYYARLAVLDFAYKSQLLTGTIFDEKGNQLDDRALKVNDFVSRIGITTNLVKDTLRNFLDRAVTRLDELKDRSIIDYTYTYDKLLDVHKNNVNFFLSICDLNDLGRVDSVINFNGLIRSVDLAAISAALDASYKEI